MEKNTFKDYQQLDCKCIQVSEQFDSYPVVRVLQGKNDVTHAEPIIKVLEGPRRKFELAQLGRHGVGKVRSNLYNDIYYM